MTCITDGALRARLDAELSENERLEVESHLADCADCRQRAEAIARQAKRAQAILSALDPLANEAPADARTAFAHFRAEHLAPGALERAPSILERLFARRLRPAWGAMAALVAVAALVSFAPARSWAQKILAMLRVQKIAVVTIDPTALAGPDNGREGNDREGRLIGKLISDNLVVTMDPGKPQAAPTAHEASQAAGFRVRTLTSVPLEPQFDVQGEGAFHMTLNRGRLQAIFEEAGRSDIQLPASLDGATIAVHVPRAVFVRYGNCRKPGHGDAAPPDQGQSAAPDSGCTFLAEVPSPTVSVPPDLNIGQVAEAALQLGGMSAEAAHAFCQTVDWTSTLVIPVPRDASSYQTVAVDGVEGTLISMSRLGARRPAGYTLLWVKNGIIYSLAGQGDSGNAVALAGSLE